MRCGASRACGRGPRLSVGVRRMRGRVRRARARAGTDWAALVDPTCACCSRCLWLGCVAAASRVSSCAGAVRSGMLLSRVQGRHFASPGSRVRASAPERGAQRGHGAWICNIISAVSAPPPRPRVGLPKPARRKKKSARAPSWRKRIRITYARGWRAPAPTYEKKTHVTTRADLEP